MSRSHFISTPGREYLAVKPIRHGYKKAFALGDLVDLPVFQLRGLYASRIIGLKGDNWTDVMLRRAGYEKPQDKPVESKSKPKAKAKSKLPSKEDD